MKTEASHSTTYGLLVFVAVFATPLPARAGDLDPGLLFTTRCASCHTFGRGDKVGPDLKGVTERRARPWLVHWIQSSEALIQSGDGTAVALFEQYKQQRMPDHDLSTAEVESLLDYLAAGGPAADAARQLRAASTATPAEIKRGEQLFYGKVRLASGSVACASCHSVEKQRALGGSFAPDLGKVYSRYRDKGFSRALTRPCFPGLPAAAETQAVTDSESLALRAFLRSATQGGRP